MQGDVVHPDKAAGFQELLAPSDVQALPPPTAAESAVDEKDYSGRGVVGGVAGGKPPPVIAADLAADMAREGLLSDAIEVEAARHSRCRWSWSPTSRELLNRDEIVALLLRHYPPVLRQAGVEGSALVQFVVDTNGRVDPQVGDGRVLDQRPVRRRRDRSRPAGPILSGQDRVRRARCWRSP